MYGWNDDSWRDTYDEWKLRSPEDDYRGVIHVDLDGNFWENDAEYDDYMMEIEALDAIANGELPDLDEDDLIARCGS